jgi:hypothetical protein
MPPRLPRPRSKEAVYIAWGKPAHIYTNHLATGEDVLWRYYTTQRDSYRLWKGKGVTDPQDYHEPFTPEPEDLLSRHWEADVRIEDGVVTHIRSWQPAPR